MQSKAVYIFLHSSNLTLTKLTLTKLTLTKLTLTKLTLTYVRVLNNKLVTYFLFNYQ